jgi:hypothetical protein
MEVVGPNIAPKVLPGDQLSSCLTNLPFRQSEAVIGGPTYWDYPPYVNPPDAHFPTALDKAVQVEAMAEIQGRNLLAHMNENLFCP